MLPEFGGACLRLIMHLATMTEQYHCLGFDFVSDA